MGKRSIPTKAQAEAAMHRIRQRHLDRMLLELAGVPVPALLQLADLADARVAVAYLESIGQPVELPIYADTAEHARLTAEALRLQREAGLN